MVGISEKFQCWILKNLTKLAIRKKSSAGKILICMYMYIIKVKGKVKIPDYVQIRDEAFTLLAYFRADRPERALEKCGFEDHKIRIINAINEMEYGIIKKIEI